jgi:hypothetical protein
MKVVPHLLALVACVPILQAESVTLYPSQDSDIYTFLDQPTSTIYTLGVSASGPGAPHSQRSLIQFNFAPLTIPAAEIGTAVLRVYVVPPDQGVLTAGNVSVYSQEKSWTVANPTLHLSDFAPGDFIGFLPVLSTSTNKWLELDATALVKSWSSGAKPNYGFELQPESETATPLLNATFASMEVNGLGGTVGPQLVITRAIAPAAPPVLAITPGPGADQVTVSWPVSTSAGWALQQATSPGGPWTADPSTATTSSDGQFQVTHSVTAAAVGFFRLIK